MPQGCSQGGDSIISIAHPEVSAVPIIETNEPLVDLRGQSTILLGPSPEIPNNQDYTKMRSSVYKKLVQAQEQLPKGLRFCLYEGYRSLKLQKKLFDERYQLLKRENKSWDHEHLFNETTKLIAPLTNLDGSKYVPPHSTGAAIDVYLVNYDGEPVDMGIHPKDWMKDVDGSMSQTDSLKISGTAQENRKIMSHVLESVGFVNYPREYWHWSYGDRYWAYNSGHKSALYNTVNQ